MNRNWLMGVALGAVVGVLASTVVQATNAQSQAAAQARPVASWEYRVEKFSRHEDSDTYDNRLNALAAEGWEYVGPLLTYSVVVKGTTRESYSDVAFRRLKN